MEESNVNESTSAVEETNVKRGDENIEEYHSDPLAHQNFTEQQQIVEPSTEDSSKSDNSYTEYDVNTFKSTDLTNNEFNPNNEKLLPVNISNELNDTSLNLGIQNVITDPVILSEIETSEQYRNATQYSSGNKEIPDFIQRIIEFLDSSRFNKTANDVHCSEHSLLNSLSETKTTSVIEECEGKNSEVLTNNFETDDRSLLDIASNINSDMPDENVLDKNLNCVSKNVSEFTDCCISNAEKDDSSILELRTSETINELFDEINKNFGNNFEVINEDKHQVENIDFNHDTVEENKFHNKSINSKNLSDSESVCLHITNGGKKTYSPIHTSNSEVRVLNNLEFNNDVMIKSNLKRINNDETDNKNSVAKKARKGITFDSVSVYYFPRTQGFTCIPSQGGSTLGMSWNHSHIRKFSLGEHAAEQRRAHRQFCSQQFSPSRNWNEMSTMSSEDSDSDEIISDSEMDYENYNFLQPISTRERRAMLRAAGINKIDSEEKDECRSIRQSREFCGCTCQMYCDPERCVCAQAGIKCQVDRMNFPCSCTREGCANENGRIEFNPVRVRTHYIHTLMRLEMEKKNEEEEQRNRMILNNLESSSQLSYTASSLSSGVTGSGLMNFSYHNNLPAYYAQPSTYPISTTSALDNTCFNINYITANEHFVLPSANDIVSYAQPTSTNIKLSLENSVSSDAEYRSSSSPSSEKCLHLSEYNKISIEQESQDFVIRDLTNNSESKDPNITFNSDSFIQIANENFGNTENASQEGNLDTSTEISEETEKEESDSENFCDIIEKPMVESVIA